MKYVTLHKITVSAPGDEFEYGGNAADGTPIMRKRSLTIGSQQFVELSEEQAKELLRHDAVRKATAVELRMGKVDNEVKVAQ